MKTRGTYLLRQEFSSARSGQVEYEIDWDEKVIQFHMASAGGHEFLNPDALTDLVKNVLPERYGIVAFDRDSENSHSPVATEWRVVVALEGFQLRVRLINPIVGGVITEIYRWQGHLNGDTA